MGEQDPEQHDRQYVRAELDDRVQTGENGCDMRMSHAGGHQENGVQDELRRRQRADRRDNASAAIGDGETGRTGQAADDKGHPGIRNRAVAENLSRHAKGRGCDGEYDTTGGIHRRGKFSGRGHQRSLEAWPGSWFRRAQQNSSSDAARYAPLFVGNDLRTCVSKTLLAVDAEPGRRSLLWDKDNSFFAYPTGVVLPWRRERVRRTEG